MSYLQLAASKKILVVKKGEAFNSKLCTCLVLNQNHGNDCRKGFLMIDQNKSEEVWFLLFFMASINHGSGELSHIFPLYPAMIWRIFFWSENWLYLRIFYIKLNQLIFGDPWIIENGIISPYNQNSFKMIKKIILTYFWSKQQQIIIRNREIVIHFQFCVF